MSSTDPFAVPFFVPCDFAVVHTSYGYDACDVMATSFYFCREISASDPLCVAFARCSKCGRPNGLNVKETSWEEYAVIDVMSK